jgi:hypothetical protein
MGLFDFLKRKKKTGEDAAAREPEDLLSLDGADLSGIEPSETRYTQEYQDYLAAQEAAKQDGAPFGEE